MKKLHTLKTALCLVLFVTVLSCNRNTSQLSKVIEELNQQLPRSLGQLGEMTSVSINGNFMEMVIEVNEDLTNLEALRKSPDLMHEGIEQMVTNGNVRGMDVIINELIDSKLGMKMVYIGKTSHTEVSVSVTPKELKQLWSHKDDPKNPDELLDAQIRITNIQLPIDLDNNMTMERFFREGNYVVYYYTWDDDMIDLLKGSEKEMKEELVKYLNSDDDPSVVMLNNICKDAGVGLAYRYVGREKGREITIYINNDEF